MTKSHVAFNPRTYVIQKFKMWSKWRMALNFSSIFTISHLMFLLYTFTALLNYFRVYTENPSVSNLFSVFVYSAYPKPYANWSFLFSEKENKIKTMVWYLVQWVEKQKLEFKDTDCVSSDQHAISLIAYVLMFICF